MDSGKKPKRIILLSDGTGNSAAKLFRTNVWRVYQALDLSRADQIAHYDDGVGTSTFRPLAILGGAVGWGLKRNVLDLYTFLCRNYEEGDLIYAFGFSRGAFTARVLIKLVLSQGIISEFYSEDDLRWKAKQLYRAFRREQSRRFNLATIGRALRDVLVWLVSALFGYHTKSIARVDVQRIRFVGVWDTVDAYGIPIYELKKGIDRYIWPLALEDKRLDHRIEKACHAICIDDERKTFHPIIWDERNVDRFPIVNSTDHEQLTQVFFAGMHSNVGGGYPDDGLSYLALSWMLKEAIKAGLTFDEIALTQLKAQVQPFGKIYDSRSGFGSYYRYEPRYLSPPTDIQGNTIPYPKIHESVVSRIAFGINGYAPCTFPLHCRVLVEQSWSEITQGKRGNQNSYHFEKFVEAKIAGFESSRSDGEQPASHFQKVRVPDNESTDLIWDTVWWRRIAYFGVFVASLGLLAAPIYTMFTTEFVDILFDGLRFSDIKSLHDTRSLISIFSPPAVRWIAETAPQFLPGFTLPWTDAFRAAPANFGFLCLLLGLFLFWGSAIDRRIKDRSLAAWNHDWQARRAKWFKNSLAWRQRIALGGAVFALMIVGRLIYILYHPLSCGPLAFGCNLENDGVAVLREIAVFVLLGVALFAVLSFFLFRGMASGSRGAIREPRGFALGCANFIRTSRLLTFVHEFFVGRSLPAIFAVLVIAISVIVLNRALFTSVEAVGRICLSLPDGDAPFLDVDQTMIFELKLSTGCHAAGVTLSGLHKYRVKVVSYTGIPEEKFPNSILAIPFLRDLRANRYQAMVRLGSAGLEVHAVSFNAIELQPKAVAAQAFGYVNDIVVGWPSFYDRFYGAPGLIWISIENLGEVRRSENDVTR